MMEVSEIRATVRNSVKYGICYMVTDIVGFLIIRLIPALATFFLATLSNRRSAMCAAIQTDMVY